jgi:hypothetical protein
VNTEVPAVTGKVTAAHLTRGAYLYVRQSSLKQVINNTESTQRQYALRHRAIALGWTDAQITVIDTDQGHSRPPSLAGMASPIWSPRSSWVEPGACAAWRSPAWHATTPTGTGCWRSAP